MKFWNKMFVFEGKGVLFRQVMVAGLVALLAMSTGCSDDAPDSPEDPIEIPGDKPDAGSESDVPVYTVTESREYTRSQFVDHALGGYGAQMGDYYLNTIKMMLGYSTPDNSTYHEAVIRYQSIDHKGKPIDLSGIVCYKTTPGAVAEIGQIILDNHATITDNASCPSEAGSTAGLLMLSSSTAVISADYQGYGVSRSALHPYLNARLTARQQVDMAKCAVDYLSHSVAGLGFSTEIATYSVGYSQGGAAALAVHRCLENEDSEFASSIGFAGSVCGDGPYSLQNTFAAYLKQGTVSIPVVLPMIVRSMLECYPELFAGMGMTDFFSDDFLNAGGGLLGLLDQKELNVIEYNTLLGASNPLTDRFDITSILKPEALDAASPQMAAMSVAFGYNNCILGWIPSRPVGFYHSKDDTVVPYDNLADLSSWPDNIYTVSGPSRSGVDHLAGAILFYTDLFLKGPAKML